MLLNLTDLSSEPLQSQIVRQVRAKILIGELDADTSLPSIRALAREQHVSVITVQRAYETLIREELIHSRRGKGFFVSELANKRKEEMAKQRLLENLSPLVSAALEEGLSQKDIKRAIDIIL
ncbi:GntR family transcriptional regulator, partial [candidate division KSB1 bacterium]|nr:GntR family transcriptional regulator [candidate division KSB1 bacterium]